MPLKDLLWACPLCHRIEGLDATGRCTGCGAVFRRARGARINARNATGESREHGAAEWLESLPWPDLDGEGHTLPPGLQPPFEQEVVARVAGAELPVRRAGAFLGLVERFGAKRRGLLRLDEREIAFVAQSGAGERSEPGDPAGAGWHWPLADLTAIQPASSAIQLKARGAPVVSIRFELGSVRLWEQRLKYCTRLAWRAAGRGEITEFQPRIRTR